MDHHAARDEAPQLHCGRSRVDRPDRAAQRDRLRAVRRQATEGRKNAPERARAEQSWATSLAARTQPLDRRQALDRPGNESPQRRARASFFVPPEPASEAAPRTIVS